jgi:cholesterol transport system auxiliary component
MSLRTSIRRRIAVPAAAVLVSLIAGSCGTLPFDKPPPRLFLLTPKSTFRDDLPKVKWQLTIDVPIAEAGINTSRIAVQRNAVMIDYFEGANWIDTAPRMVQTLLVESFENSGRIIGVGRQSAALRADYTLLVELREFQAEYDGPSTVPSAHVRLNAKLVRLPQRVIVGTVSADYSVKAQGSRLEDVVRGFDVSLGKSLKKIVEWTLTKVPPTVSRGRRR